MYLRWKKLRRRPKWADGAEWVRVGHTQVPMDGDGVVVLSAQLVESRRVDGKPRQHGHGIFQGLAFLGDLFR